ncbi:hypothetical protein B0I35DRAFT_436033 [Stachybotrys elegans]|uniref:Rhodopsin domain-containing protein n=1 Tax=Stachybotrys elegans TaxID=80388 RepID=A0A8K0SP90_9HYPO|nr:hypothetical protein B0I35DRAFT_436033 [Stachybotrys elegans]
MMPQMFSTNVQYPASSSAVPALLCGLACSRLLACFFLIAITRATMYTQIALSTIVCASVFTAISTVAVAMHIYSRICLRLSYKVGEWIVLTAYLASLLLVAQTIWCVVSESRDESLSQVHSQFYFLAKSLLANQILWALVNTLVKISALYFKLQILGVARKIWIAAWTLISLSIAYAVATITSLGMCSPIQAAWDPAVSGTCRDQNVAYVWIEFAGAVLDILILILPLQMLINLKISRKKKIAISLLLSAGGVYVDPFRLLA